MRQRRLDEEDRTAQVHVERLREALGRVLADGLGEGGYLPLYLFLGWTLVILLACLVMQWRAKS